MVELNEAESQRLKRGTCGFAGLLLLLALAILFPASALASGGVLANGAVPAVGQVAKTTAPAVIRTTAPAVIRTTAPAVGQLIRTTAPAVGQVIRTTAPAVIRTTASAVGQVIRTSAPPTRQVVKTTAPTVQPATQPNSPIVQQATKPNVPIVQRPRARELSTVRAASHVPAVSAVTASALRDSSTSAFGSSRREFLASHPPRPSAAFAPPAAPQLPGIAVPSAAVGSGLGGTGVGPGALLFFFILATVFAGCRLLAGADLIPPAPFVPLTKPPG